MQTLAGGARHSFLVLTDHKNLEYLRTTKRLNPRQALWAVFYTRFNFSISYQPGSKNTKDDALSYLYLDGETSEEPECIFPAKCFVNVITWDFDEKPAIAVHDHVSAECPPKRRYRPPQLRAALSLGLHLLHPPPAIQVHGTHRN